MQLTASFTTALILRIPDPDLPLIIKVDISRCVIGAVLLQHHGDPSKVYPNAFFSRKLTSAEANYHVGNCELLSIKEALEEWHHWLEGAHHPLLILMAHRNLENLCNAKRLNLCQSRWALSFNQFHFTVTYRPGTNANALSNQHDPHQPHQSRYYCSRQ